LQFLHSRGCIITSECYEIAEDNYEHAVMEWLRSIDAPGIPLSRRQYLRNTMRVLDEFKEHLPNGAYLELCEQLKGAYVTNGDADSFSTTRTADLRSLATTTATTTGGIFLSRANPSVG